MDKRSMNAATAATWVLLPGLNGSSALFRWFRQALPRDARVLVVSYPDRSDWQLDDYVTHVAQALSQCERPLLIAESFSGPIAWRLARRLQLVGIVFVASFLSCPNPLLRPFATPPVVLIRRAASWASLLRLVCLERNTADDRVHALRQEVRALPADLLRARWAILRKLDAAHEAPIVLPSLCLRASHDHLVTRAASRELASHTHSTVATIEGPHFLLQACPEAAAAAIRRWLDALQLNG